ncbi:MAG: Glyoxalase/Bleomycin resistance protein/Dioxygenase superfamily [Paenibacillus sp.]|nr:Glyoxalase/Bleomycin resistance protein/Dioxygenase superfamily [Paenibacillus sp.]
MTDAMSEQTVQSIIEHRLAEIYVRVKNYPKAEHFYKNVLGLPLSWGNGTCIGYFDMQGVGILLLQADEDHRITEAAFSIATRDIHAAYEHMTKEGVAVGDINAYGEAKGFHVADPEGNLITILQR